MNSENPRKFFVLDTNVILHDSSCNLQFEEHDVVLPITVLEELDQFKKGHDSINYHARKFVRTLDSLCDVSIFADGVSIGPKQGKIFVKLGRAYHPDLQDHFAVGKPDHNILNQAYYLAKENTDRPVILITKDVNLRMKAKSVGLESQDYISDRVRDVSSLYRGMRTLENVPSELVNQLYELPYEANPDLLESKQELNANEYLIVRNHHKSGLAKFNKEKNTISRVDKRPAYGIHPRNAEQTFALDALLNNELQLVTISGKAGTGKTLLAISAALEKRHDYRQIYVARPVVPLSNKDLGYLPGDISSKLDPYMQPLYDNLSVIEHQFEETENKRKQIREFLDNDKLTIAPLAYIRGRSLGKIFFIVDEAQNLTPHEIKTIITRAGEGTKLVFTGDIFQIDHPYLDSSTNGLSFLIEKMQGQSIYAHINLEKGERSKLAELASDLL